MPDHRPPLARAAAFCERFGLRLPILLAPMAGVCPASLSIAVANAGGMGAAGVLMFGWGPAVPAGAGDAMPPDFGAQCQAVLDAEPTAVSSIMGLFPEAFVAQLWAGQSAALGRAEPAANLVERLWSDGRALLGGG